MATLEERIAERIAKMRQYTEGEYMTTETSCMCPDHKYRHRTCKHMSALIERNKLAEAEVEVAKLNRFFAGESND